MAQSNLCKVKAESHTDATADTLVTSCSSEIMSEGLCLRGVCFAVTPRLKRDIFFYSTYTHSGVNAKWRGKYCCLCSAGKIHNSPAMESL